VPDPPDPSRRAPDGVLGVGLAVIAVVALVLRTVALGAHLPHLIAPDEPTVMDRALAHLHGHAPTGWDWPQGAMSVLAGLIGGVRALTPWADGTPWLFGRVVFALVGVLVVVLTGLLGAAMAGERAAPRRRRLVAWIASGLLAVSWLSVRLSRSIQPDHLQLAFVLGALLCALRYDRRTPRSTWWLAGAGLLAGAAGATKYLGVLVVVPTAVFVVQWRRAHAARELVVLAVTTVVGFVALAWGALAEPGAFWDGLTGQFGHQAGGHPGYEGQSTGWWFHATKSLPGNWGWGITVLAALGTIAALIDGDRRQRVVALFAIGLFAVVGLSRVEFPHYMVIVLPLLAVLAAMLVARVVDHAASRYAAIALAGIVLLVAPTVADDVRLVRAQNATDTRELVDPFLRSLDGPLLVEWYASLPATGTAIGDVPARPDIVDCNCFVALSSYREERYRRHPRKYASEVAAYDRVRAAGTLVRVIGPHPHLAYNWDVLPRWGLDRVPLTGDISAVGPTITVLDLRR
jgi:4-amino-4-deoxy-L-arabinose transferase-like glycosyltransferase